MGAPALDHLNLSIPSEADVLDRARCFYGRLLDLQELRQPKQRIRGLWFLLGAAQQFHLAVDPDFVPACHARLALLVNDLAALQAALHEAGDERMAGDPQPGVERMFTHDPFGNRRGARPEGNKADSVPGVSKAGLGSNCIACCSTGFASKTRSTTP
ncbi:glyoxalase [Caldimonas tepidiphila]|uniref:glyoxalase n=1 Tax=Caldimonas tepidiphila TaxID=2315841 RepID=UPI001300B879|nr:glyoxalase [Caldimonas tepidiphila]